ncbi:RNA polymerase sigma factor [Pseudochryseolinea flava]|uniref:Sigma-70 family RNA polymerase sigma factor n=1 Tax=Pseudochryseolinea flava TaxID=2059302 RepID=A0A364XXR9_9BACT|nr:sigma-70 family RNA polymerase sigma factor [Pseudochryseolinea flava]RAV98214.1 sigma-70 family RNA polymerase sigma factor [Pseudochryseolinea flava]
MRDFSSYSDLEIWSSFRAGDEDAFAYIYQHQASSLLKYGYQIGKDKALVEDCVHDLFIHLSLHRATINDTTSIKYYLFKSLRRKIIEALDRQQTGERHLKTYFYWTEKKSKSFEENLIAEQTTETQVQNLARHLKDLPPRQQEALYLVYYSNLSYEEIASIMSLQVRTVYNHVHTGLETLRSKMKEPGFERIIPLLILALALQYSAH